MTGATRSPWWRPTTLSRQLVLGVSALVTVVVVLVGALSVYSMRTYVTSMSDTEVLHSLSAFEHSFTKLAKTTLPGDADAAALAAFTGQAPGTVIAVMRGQQVVGATVFSDGEPRPAAPETKRAIEAQDWTQVAPRSLKLGELGSFRAASSGVGDGQRLISAVSLETANRAIAKKTVAVVVITFVAVLVAALGTVVLVRQALRPLRRVAATAARAARMPLEDEDHRITTRVRHSDSDPDNEVGIVGETLNRLLANVDSALAARSESDRRMRRFLTDASHELRTPLTAIQGYAELTRQESSLLPPTTEYALARIESESRRMTTLVGDMLLLSRLDEGQGLEVERMDLCELVVDAVNDLSVSAPEHQWAADLPDEPVWILGDRSRLHQAVSNLLANASVHTPAGVRVVTTVRPGTADPWVELTVADDGPGIDPEIMPDLFGRFVRADKSRSRETDSTGLGLAIVKSITEAHGGTVSATSRRGATVLRLRLPAMGSDRRPAARASSDSPAISHSQISA